MLNEPKIIIKDDKCFVEMPEHQYDAISPRMSKYQLVMTKEIFIECYNKWIKNSEDSYL